MAVSVQMPALGESVTEGTVTRWLKQEGDTVAVDEPLLEVSTDKVDTEIPSPAAGVLTKIVAQEDDVVDLSELDAELEDGSEDDGFRSSMASLKASAIDQIHQTLNHPGKVSLWDKTVGTMRHLAERAPAFKPVLQPAMIYYKYNSDRTKYKVNAFRQKTCFHCHEACLHNI